MTDPAALDAERFAEALEAVEAGGEADLDPREDPTLAALARLAAQVGEAAGRATATARFGSYRARARSAVLHRVARERAAAGASRPRRLPGLPVFRLSFLAPAAVAAAAAAIALAFVALQQGGASAPAAPPAAELRAAVAEPPVTPPVPIAPGARPRDPAPLPGAADARAAADAADAPALPPPGSAEPVEPGQEERAAELFVSSELRRIDALIARVSDRVARAEAVDPALLRGVTESILAVAWHIENQPDGVLRAQVISYIKAAADTRILLAAAHTEAGSAALSAARRASQDGVAVASWYFTYY